MDGMQRRQADELEEIEKRQNQDVEILKAQFAKEIGEIKQMAEAEKLRALVRSSGPFLMKANSCLGFERRRGGNSRTESQTSPGKFHYLILPSPASEQISSTETGSRKNLNRKTLK
jgi:hypothetical protein